MFMRLLNYDKEYLIAKLNQYLGKDERYRAVYEYAKKVMKRRMNSQPIIGPIPIETH